MTSAGAPTVAIDASDDAAWIERARQSLRDSDTIAREQFGPGCDIEWLLRSRAARADQLITTAWNLCVDSTMRLHLFAVGGYGRAELFPQSDIDLLIFVEGDSPDFDAQQAIARFTSLLWDAGLPVGHSVRTQTQCTDAAAQDITIITALLDARPLQASAPAINSLRAAVSPALVWGPQAYFNAKVSELRERHMRYGNTSDNLEPNIKEGPGGLRDLQTLAWIANRVAQVGSLDGLIDIDHSGLDEIRTLQMQHVILSRLRFGLGLVAGRREERLRFDYQRDLAQLLGFDAQGNQAVEDMMQGFYRSAALVRRIGERLLQRFEEQLDGQFDVTPIASNPRFGLANRYVVALDPEFPRDATDILDLFLVWGCAENAKGLHSQTARALGERLELMPEYQVAEPAVRDRFMHILREARPAKILSRMSRLGVLQRFIPAFRGVSGRMQFDLFHAFTVDQHTLSVLANIEGFARQVEDSRFSIANDVYPALRKPELLYLAGLFHDIAKGRRGDHSELGAVDALAFCLAMGLGETQSALVAWLVRYHLLMSTTAQKQDIDDPDIIHAFALQVGDRDHLDYLYLLTIADIAATGPKIWTDWKDQVLAKAYTRTRLAMRRGLEQPINAQHNARETRADVEQLLVMRDRDLAQITVAADKIPQSLFERATADQVAWIADSIIAANGATPVIAVRRLRADSDDLEVLINTADADGLFAAIVIALDRANLEIQQARALKGPADDVFDIFVVRPLDVRSEIVPAELESRLRDALTGDWQSVRPTRRRAPSHLKHFRVPTHVDIRTGTGTQDGKFILSLVCNDRPGLLADLSHCLKSHGIAVHDARIATFGERAEDIFQISGSVLTDAHTHPQAIEHLRDSLTSCIDGVNS